MNSKATPRRQPEARQNQVLTDCKELIASVVPYRHLAADYVLLAAILFRPELAHPYLSRLHPLNWSIDLHRHAARMAMAQVQAYGYADIRQLEDMLLDAGAAGRHRLDIEFETIAWIAGLIQFGTIVPDAVRALSARQPRTAA